MTLPDAEFYAVLVHELAQERRQLIDKIADVRNPDAIDAMRERAIADEMRAASLLVLAGALRDVVQCLRLQRD